MFGDEVTRKDILSFQEIMVRFWEKQIKLMPARKRSAEEGEGCGVQTRAQLYWT